MNSPQPTKQLLWNVAEPGDPYDIKNSTIALIPGHKRLFMGDNIQMICLFQAAEIQRLMEYLGDYKLKYKELQRIQLDRHSYEIQIKQLTQMHSDSENLRIEVAKLRSFIKRQTQELQIERSNNKLIDFSLDKKYSQALKELQLQIGKNQRLMAQSQSNKTKIKVWESRYEALEKSKARQIQQLKGQSHRHSIFQKQLRQLNHRFSGQRNQFQLQIQRLKDELNAKQGLINKLQIQLSNYNRSVHQKQNQIKNLIISQYEGRQRKFKSEIEYLNHSITNKSVEIQELNMKYNTLYNQSFLKEEQLSRLSTTIRELENRINQLSIDRQRLQKKCDQRSGVNSRLEEATDRIVFLNEQIKRMQNMNNINSKEVDILTSKNRKLQYDYESIRRQYSIVSNKLSELQNSYADLGELRNSLVKITKQNSILKESLDFNQETNKRLGLQLQRVEQQLANSRQQFVLLSGENSQFKMKINQLMRTLQYYERSNSIIGQLEKRNMILQKQRDVARKSLNDFQKQFNSSKQSISNQYQQRINQLRGTLEKQRNSNSIQVQQISERMRNMAKSHDERVKSISKELQISKRRNNAQNQHETTKKKLRQATMEVSNWEIKYNEAEQQRNRLSYLVYQLEQKLRNMGGEERILRYAQQIQKLNQRIQQKNQQLLACEKVLNQLQTYRLKYGHSIKQIENYKNKIHFLQNNQNREQQQKIIFLNKQIQLLRKQLVSQDLKGKIQQYENRLATLNEEIDRLKNRLSLKSQQYTQLQLIYQRTCMEREQLDTIAHELQEKLRGAADPNKIAQLDAKINGYQTKFTTQISEINILNQRIRDLQIQNASYNDSIRNYTNKIEKLNLLKIQNQSSNQKIRIGNQENRRLIENIKLFQREIKDLQQKLKNSKSDRDSLKDQIETLLNKIREGQVAKEKVKDLQYQKNQLVVSLENKNIQFSELNNSLRTITNQHQKVCQLLQSKQTQNSEQAQVILDLNEKILNMNRTKQYLNLSYDEAIKNNSGLEMTIQKLQSQLQIINRKVKDVQRSKSAQQKYRLQVERLIFDNSAKQAKITALQKLVNQLEVDSHNSIALGEQIDKLKSRNNQLITKVSQYQRQVLSSSSAAQSYKAKLIISQDKLNQSQHTFVNSIRQKDSILQNLKTENVDLKQKLSLNNSDYSLKISNYQKDFSYLKLQNEMLNKSLTESRNQLDKLTEDNKNLRIQISEINKKQLEYRNQANAYEKKLILQEQRIDQVNLKNENLKQNVFDNQILIASLRKQISSLVSSNEETTILREKISQLQVQKQDYKSRLIKVGDEIQRLNGVLRHKIDQIEAANRRYNILVLETKDEKQRATLLTAQNLTLKKSINELNQKIVMQAATNNNLYEMRIEELNKRIFNYQDQLEKDRRQIASLQQRIVEKNMLQDQNRQKSNGYLRKIAQYQEKINSLKLEVSRLDLLLRGKVDVEDQLYSAKRQNQRLCQSLKTKMETDNKITSYLKEIQRLNNALRLKVQESRQMQDKYLDLENDINYSHQLQRLSRALSIATNQCKQWQDKYGLQIQQSDIIRQKYNQLVKDYELIRKKYMQMQQKFPKLNAQFDNLSQIIASLQKQLLLQKQQNYNLTTKLSNNSVSSAEQKNQVLALQIQRLNNKIRGLEEQLQELRLRYVDQNALEQRIKQHLGLFVILFAQIQSLRKRVKDKQKEVDQIKRSSLVPFIISPSP